MSTNRKTSTVTPAKKTRSKGWTAILFFTTAIGVLALLAGVVLATLYVRTEGFTADMTKVVPQTVEQPLKKIAAVQYQSQTSMNSWDETAPAPVIDGMQTCTRANEGSYTVAATDGTSYYSVMVMHSSSGWVQQEVRDDASDQLWVLCNTGEVVFAEEQSPFAGWLAVFFRTPVSNASPEM